ncbi:hypothetical protein [Halopiger goleimassiliensis]|uniref:hypothetical protein n=1 Tax=Halopiger goleimassiliensis TaxID=1293048 RepID=UPI0006777513|nr:hypothetical protein [Halopiger goleimassiliensis]
MTVRSSAAGGLAAIRSRIGPLRPRLVLALLSFAALAGTWIVTRRTHSGVRPALVVANWGLVLTLGALLGGVGWRLFLYPDRRPDDDASRSFVERRYALLEWSIVLGSIASVLVVAVRSAGSPAVDASVVLVLTLASVPVVIAVGRIGTSTTARWWRFVALLLGVGALSALALENVRQVNGTAIDAVVRIGHLGAVSVWLGGALWHNLIVVGVVRRFPHGRESLRAQTLAFRRVVAVLLVVVALTGVVQAARAFGTAPAFYLGTSTGLLVGAKLAIVLALSYVAASA